MNIFEEFEPTDKERVYEDDHEIRILELLNEYADSRQNYTNAFLDSCSASFAKLGYLTGKQINKLIEIHSVILSRLYDSE